jgi:hypothetical protein
MPIFLVKNVWAWPPKNTGGGNGAGYGGGKGPGNGGGPYPKPAQGSGGGGGGGAAFLNQPLKNPRLTRVKFSLVAITVVAKSKICERNIH